MIGTGVPTAHQVMALMQVFTTFFSNMFLVFFRRTLPASSKAKPHCKMWCIHQAVQQAVATGHFATPLH